MYKVPSQRYHGWIHRHTSDSWCYSHGSFVPNTAANFRTRLFYGSQSTAISKSPHIVSISSIIRPAAFLSVASHASVLAPSVKKKPLPTDLDPSFVVSFNHRLAPAFFRKGPECALPFETQQVAAARGSMDSPPAQLGVGCVQLPQHFICHSRPSCVLGVEEAN